MRLFVRFMTAAMVMLAVASCTIEHQIDSDYSQYLVNNIDSSNLPHTDSASEYYLTPATQQYTFEFRSFMTGIGNLWIISFGNILDSTMMSADVQEAFGSIEKTYEKSANSDGLLLFELQSYTFEEFAANVSLKISLIRSGEEVFSNTYSEVGRSQGGKMFWGGVFAQKNAVQQSTKLALDEILRQLINDLNAQI